ncbi:MAG: tagatose 1,6-diphosphate aldolase [Rubrivivax sp.]|jgi:tagatose 1,6-diphosphate aldolase|nr:tagatose 1,6-diphosphate aldolase [Rubrivivax sp.]
MPSPNLNLGKVRGLRRLANEAGHFTIVALDQRPPIAQMLAARLGIPASQVSFEDMMTAKRLLVQTLGPHASAMLLDPNFALPATLASLPARTGLLVTLEDHRFKDTPGGRLSHSIANWSVEKIKRSGGDGVKVLAWYRPDAAPEVLEHQQAYVRQVGDECVRHDIPFVLELLTYPFPRAAGDAQPPAQTREQGAQHVIDSLREFAKPEYRVDLFKLESPLPGANLPAPDGLAEHQAAQAWFNEMGGICREAGVPWVMLSAGVTPEQFLRVMHCAYAAGAHGFLAGRAIWAQALQQFPDLAACREVLQTQGLRTLQDLMDLTREAGHAWTPDYSSLDRIRAEGDLCSAYA